MMTYLSATTLIASKYCKQDDLPCNRPCCLCESLPHNIDKCLKHHWQSN